MVHNYAALSLSLAETDANEAADEEEKENKPEAADEVRCYFYGCWGMVACEQQTHFRFFGRREATTGNASAVRRLGYGD